MLLDPQPDPGTAKSMRIHADRDLDPQHYKKLSAE